MSQENRSDVWYKPFLIILLLVSLYLSYLVLKPFIHSMILAFLIGSLMVPVHSKLTRKLKGKSGLSAALLILAIAVLIVVPFLLFLSALVTQTLDTLHHLNAWIKAGNIQKLISNPKLQSFIPYIQSIAHRLGFEQFDINKINLTGPLVKVTQYIGQFIISNGSALLSNVVNVAVQIFIMFFVMFYVIRDYPWIIRKIKDLSPLREDQEDRILERIRAVAKSALLGSLLTAIAQGIAGGIGLAIVGIPGLFWGTLMAFTSLVPVVGTALVWIPSCLYLLLVGRWKASLFLLLWSVLIVGSIDNFLRPLFMRSVGQMSPFFVFLSIMGGIQYFGFLGLIYGPLILGCALVMVYIYEAEYTELHEKV